MEKLQQHRFGFARKLFAFCFIALLLATSSGAQQQGAPPPPPAKQQQSAKPAADNSTAQDDDEVITVESDLTNLLFTAVDKNKRFLSTLRQEDIRILEDGVPQDIFTFQKQTDLPLTLAIVIDTSASQERTLPDEKAAAQAFVDSVLRQRKDEAAVITFTGEVTQEQGLTGNTSRIRSAIERIRFVPASSVINGQVVGTPPISGTNQSLAGSTALWDAVEVTSREVLTDAPPRTRRAIVLLTDGIDTSSQLNRSDAINQALKSEVIVFSIGIGDDFDFQGVDEGALRKLSERTGGRAYFPRSEADLQIAFKEIERELREQYLIAYSPKNKSRDNRFREVKIEVANPELRKQNLKLAYRPGYFRRPASATASDRTR